MKKMMMLVAVCTVSIQAMESDNKWSIKAYGRTINLTKDVLCDAYSKIEADVMVVGENQQQILKSPKPIRTFLFDQEIGKVYFGGNVRDIYAYKNPTDQSVNTVFKYSDEYFALMQKNVVTKKVQLTYPSLFISIPEPCLMTGKRENDDKEQLFYHVGKEGSYRFFSDDR